MNRSSHVLYDEYHMNKSKNTNAKEKCESNYSSLFSMRKIRSINTSIYNNKAINSIVNEQQYIKESKISTTNKRQLVINSSNDAQHKRNNRISLSDIFQQHGLRLCDGNKLNAVGKHINSIGLLPISIQKTITSLYLSHNDFKSVTGIEQFIHVRVLSLGGNLICEYEALECLNTLKTLRHLNLMGNPLCTQPNYRYRVIDLIPQLETLDSIHILKQEKQMAMKIASKDIVYKQKITSNYFEIQQLEQFLKRMDIHRELYCYVLANISNYSQRYDRLPRVAQEHGIFSFDIVKRVCGYEEFISIQEYKNVASQMGTLVNRTHEKLKHYNVKNKGCALLLSMVNKDKSKIVVNEDNDDGHHWDRAYSQVLTLQQEIITKLQGEIEEKRKQTLREMSKLLVIEPKSRSQGIQFQNTLSSNHKIQTQKERIRSPTSLLPQVQISITKVKDNLPPQQVDPDMILDYSVSSQVPHTHRTFRSPSKLRCGDFFHGKKTLQEAVGAFKLREDRKQSLGIPRHKVQSKPNIKEPVTNEESCHYEKSEEQITANTTTSHSHPPLKQGSDCTKKSDPCDVTVPNTAYTSSMTEFEKEYQHRFDSMMLALVASEQRELDMRRQLAVVSSKLASLQDQRSKNLREKEQNEIEMNERINQIAAPLILKRHFAKWYQYHCWFVRFQRIQRKQTLKFQRFWYLLWRRKVVVQHACQNLRNRFLQRLRMTIFRYWHRQTQISSMCNARFQARIFAGRTMLFQQWRLYARNREKRKALDIWLSGKRKHNRDLIKHVFYFWIQFTKRKTSKRTFLHVKRLGFQRTILLQCFWNWRFYIRARLKPRKAQEHLLRLTHHANLYQRALLCWRTVYEEKVISRNNSVRAQRATSECILRASFEQWSNVKRRKLAWLKYLRSQKYRILRNSLNYWKIWKSTRKRQRQLTRKSYRFYYTRLLKKILFRWANQSQLFGQFRILRQISANYRDKLYLHFCIRQSKKILQKIMSAWFIVVQYQKGEQKRLLNDMWQRWLMSNRKCLGISVKKMEMERIQNKKEIDSFNQLLELEHNRRNEIDQTNRELQSRCTKLEIDLKESLTSISDFETKFHQTLYEKKEKERIISTMEQRFKQMEVQNQRLYNECSQLKMELVNGHKLHDEWNAWKSKHENESNSKNKLISQLQDARKGMELELKLVHQEREEIADKLQEYEKRIAQMCEEIQTHENARQKESYDAQNELGRLKANLDEERVRVKELEALVEEKNGFLLAKENEVRKVTTDDQVIKNFHSMENNQDKSGMKFKLPKKPEYIKSQPTFNYVHPQNYEWMNVDEHTNRIHDDLRNLQDRLIQRLAKLPTNSPLLPCHDQWYDERHMSYANGGISHKSNFRTPDLKSGQKEKPTKYTLSEKSISDCSVVTDKYSYYPEDFLGGSIGRTHKLQPAKLRETCKDEKKKIGNN